MKDEIFMQKIQTLRVIETELKRRIKAMKTSTINIKIALSNGDTKALGVVADDYTKRLDEMSRLVLTMDKILFEINDSEG